VPAPATQQFSESRGWPLRESHPIDLEPRGALRGARVCRSALVCGREGPHPGRAAWTLGERVSTSAEGSTCEQSASLQPCSVVSRTTRTWISFSDSAHDFDGLTLRVFKQPALAPQATDDLALLATTNGRRSRRSASESVALELRPYLRQIDIHLSHRCDDFGVDIRTGPRSRRQARRLRGIGEAVEPGRRLSGSGQCERRRGSR